MFLYEFIIKEILIEKWKSILMISTSFILILFLGIFTKKIITNEKNLDAIYKTIEVKVSIIREDDNNDLMLPIEMLTEIESSDYFKESILSAAFDYNIINSSSEAIEIYAISDNNDFFTNSFVIGDASQDLSYGQSIVGEYLPFTQNTEKNLITIYSDEEMNKNINIDLTIVKRILGNNIYLNYDQYLDICKTLDIPIIIFSAEYIIKDTKKISDIHNFLSSLEVFSRDYKCTYKIYDEILDKSTTPLLRNIKILKGVYPILFILIICIGFVLSYISGRLEKRKLFLMQSMGNPKWFRFIFFFSKQFIYSIMGALLGGFFLDVRQIFLYLCCYWIGSAISIIRMLYMNYYEVGRE